MAAGNGRARKVGSRARGGGEAAAAVRGRAPEPNGRHAGPGRSTPPRSADERRVLAKFLGQESVSQYAQSLAMLGSSPEHRAREPLQNHPWIYACAATTAIVLSQAPLLVWAETVEEMEGRAIRAKRLGQVANPAHWVPFRGARRSALARHTRPLARRFLRRGREPVEGTQFGALLADPNPLQDGLQLVQQTAMGLATGEFFWLLESVDGQPMGLGQVPDVIWPAPSQIVSAWFSRPTGGGSFLGWRVALPRWHPGYSPGSVREYPADTVVQFKLPGASDPVRGFNPLAAAAAAIESDMLVRSLNRSLIKNDGTPKSVIYHPTTVTQDEEERLREEWRDRFEGPLNAGRTAHLFGSRIEKLSWSPREMEFQALSAANREEELAVMRTPPSILGVADLMSYATQLGQDKNYWSKTVMPIAAAIEAAIDRRFFWDEPDTVFVAFDVSGVEALRAGITEMISDANAMAGSQLHAPPRVAYQVVGLDVPSYPADDVAFVPALSTPAGEAAQGLPDLDPAEPAPTAGGDGGGMGEPASSPAAAAARGPLLRSQGIVARQAAARWRQYVRVEAAVEGRMRRSYRGWVAEERSNTLARFDRAARGEKSLLVPGAVGPVRKVLDLTRVLPDLDDLIVLLRQRVRPIFAAGLEAAWNFTEEEIGVPTFAIDDAVFVRHFSEYESRLSTETPEALVRNLRATLEEGLRTGETVAELRLRVSQVFNVTASSSKTLLVARTSTNGFMNSVREGMFDRSGITRHEWTTAGDEEVRADHVAFGDAGPQEIGFNFAGLATVAPGGTLEYPGDLRAPFGQIANCRCFTVAAE